MRRNTEWLAINDLITGNIRADRVSALQQYLYDRNSGNAFSSQDVMEVMQPYINELIIRQNNRWHALENDHVTFTNEAGEIYGLLVVEKSIIDGFENRETVDKYPYKVWIAAFDVPYERGATYTVAVGHASGAKTVNDGINYAIKKLLDNAYLRSEILYAATNRLILALKGGDHF